MNEQRPRSIGIVLISIALSAPGCGGGGDGPEAGATAGRGGAGGNSDGAGAGNGGSSMAGANTLGVPLVWDAGGFVAPVDPFQIQGPFYFYSDCDEASGLPCTEPDSTLMGADSKPGWSVADQRVCAKGTAVKVTEGMFAKQWGAGLALDLNSKGGEVGVQAAKGTFDLKAAGIHAFSVDMSGTAPARIRINLTMPGVPDSNFVDAQVPGTTTFEISDAKQGTWVKDKTPLDPTKVEALQFQVFTNAASTTPFDYCITAVRAISSP